MPPRPKLSLAQTKALMRRYLRGKSFVGTTREAADEIFKYEPPIEKTMTTLNRKVPIEGVQGDVTKMHPELYRMQPERMPYDQAFEQYMENPRMFGKPTGAGYEPPADVLRTTGVGSPEEMAEGMAYERIKTKPFALPQGMQQNVRSMQAESERESIARGMTARGLAPEDISVAPKQFLRQEGVVPEKAAVEDLVERAMVAEMLWKAGASDKRTVMNRVWKTLYDEQKAVVKQTYKSPKEYFLYCFRQFEKNPGQFANKRPDEHQVIEGMYKILDESIPE